MDVLLHGYAQRATVRRRLPIEPVQRTGPDRLLSWAPASRGGLLGRGLCRPVQSTVTEEEALLRFHARNVTVQVVQDLCFHAQPMLQFTASILEDGDVKP